MDILSSYFYYCAIEKDFSWCWSTRKPFDIESRACGFFALTMNGWRLHYLQKRIPRLLENSAFFIYHNILFQEDLYSFRRSNCSIKRLLRSNFALFNQILPVGRSFVDVYFSERFWQVSTRQQLRAKWLVDNFWPSLHCYWWESISIFPSHLMINRAVILIICSTSLCLQGFGNDKGYRCVPILILLMNAYV